MYPILGCMVFPPLATYIISLYGWQNCLRIFAALHLVCAVCSLTYRPVSAPADDKKCASAVDSCNNIYTQPESEQCIKNRMGENEDLR